MKSLPHENQHMKNLQVRGLKSSFAWNFNLCFRFGEFGDEKWKSTRRKCLHLLDVVVMVRSTFPLSLFLDSGGAFRWFWGQKMGIFYKKSKLFKIEQWCSLSSLDERLIFFKFELLIYIWNIKFGSNFNGMLKTKSTFSREKVQIWESTPSNLKSVHVWEYDVMKS